MSDQPRHPNHQRIIDELTANPAPLIEWAALELVSLGAKTEWSMDDNFTCTEGLAELPVRGWGYDLPGASNQDEEALRFYGEAARALGFHTDLDDESIGGPQ